MPSTATPAATGIATRNQGAKSAVRASRATASHAVPAIVAASSAVPAHDSRANRHSATRPMPASAATAGASALT